MRHITISILSVFITLPALAAANLPVVNIASGGISARSAFGVATPVEQNNVTVAPVARTVTQRPVIARIEKDITPVVSVDTGEKIIASNDVLVPRRPSADLWAKNDTALRMPMPNEFSVIRSDNLLPEESLDQHFASVEPVAPDVPVSAPALSHMDAQIARLNELQQRADASVRSVSPRVIAAPIAETKPVLQNVIASADTVDAAQPVSVRRMVVPMDTPDVVVRSVEKNVSSRIASVRDDMTKMSPAQLRQAFRKTFLSENKHLSTYPISDDFDVASDMSTTGAFSAVPDLSEGSGIRPLEIKINFRNEDSSLSRDNYSLLTEYAGIIVNKPTRAVQIAIPQHMTRTADTRKLAARRLAIVEQVLTDNGIAKQRILPVLSARDDSGLVLRMISSDEYEVLTKQKSDIFGDTVSKKTYKSMSW